MRLTYFGQQNLAGVQRWHVMMASENKTWVVAKNDLDGNWFNADDQALEVTLVPTIWNVLKRLALLEDSAYANVNAAIQVMQGTEKVLSERVAHVEEQRKSHADFVLKLVDAQHQECLEAVEGVKKVDVIETKVAELAEGLRSVNEQVSQVDTTNTDALVSRLDAKMEQLSKEIHDTKEKVHYASVKKEEDKYFDDHLEQIELLRGTVGSCLLRTEELSATCSRLSGDVWRLQKELGNISRPQEIVDLCLTTVEPGELQECTCKRPRT